MKKDCKIVQDLLPNYIEKVTTEETNAFIEEHLENCKECSKIYASMKESMGLDPVEADKEVRYMKKFSKQLNILKFLIITVFFIFVLVTGRKLVIMNTVAQKASNSLDKYSTNYHMKFITYTGTEVTHTEIYFRENDYLSITKMGTIGEIYSERINFRKNGEEINLFNGKDIKLKSSKILGRPSETPPIFENDFFSNFQLSFRVSIGTSNISSKKCYVIKDKSFDKFIDKDTGLVIKEINTVSNSTTDYYFYEFGTVKDDDIVRPDTTGYIEEN